MHLKKLFFSLYTETNLNSVIPFFLCHSWMIPSSWDHVQKTIHHIHITIHTIVQYREEKIYNTRVSKNCYMLCIDNVLALDFCLVDKLS